MQFRATVLTSMTVNYRSCDNEDKGQTWPATETLCSFFPIHSLSSVLNIKHAPTLSVLSLNEENEAIGCLVIRFVAILCRIWGETKAWGGRGGEGEDEDEGEGGEVKCARSGQMLHFRVKLSSHYHTAHCAYVCLCVHYHNRRSICYYHLVANLVSPARMEPIHTHVQVSL